MTTCGFPCGTSVVSPCTFPGHPTKGTVSRWPRVFVPKDTATIIAMLRLVESALIGSPLNPLLRPRIEEVHPLRLECEPHRLVRRHVGPRREPGRDLRAAGARIDEQLLAQGFHEVDVKRRAVAVRRQRDVLGADTEHHGQT